MRIMEISEINKDALIAAQGVLKCVTQTDPATAWNNFLWLYQKFNTWDGTVPNVTTGGSGYEPDEPPPYDDIPY